MFEKLFPILCFSIFLLSTVMELLSDSPFLEKEIPETKMTLPQNNVPTITIQYCHSCGYQKKFMEYANLLAQKYPDFKVHGEYYEPSGFYQLLAKFLNLARTSLILVIIFEKNIFALFGNVDSTWWRWCVNNKIYACLSIFFLSNMFESMLVSSGAFEISFNGVPLWSKIESGRIPQPLELFNIIDGQMNFDPSSVEFNPGMFPKTT